MILYKFLKASFIKTITMGYSNEVSSILLIIKPINIIIKRCLTFQGCKSWWIECKSSNPRILQKTQDFYQRK
jgi:hypothetical protein